MAEKSKTKRIAEYLKYTFSDPEQSENAKQLARKTQQLVELDLKKKQLMADIKAEAEEGASAVARLARWVNDGYDFRMIDCEVQYDRPKRGQKRIVRLDTGEEVVTRNMDSAELQDSLPLTDEPEKK